ncbi:DUF4214 domain-containing protein [Rhizobium sp. LjRoot30]
MTTVQGAYVALLGRPADPEGLAYFNELTNNGTDLSGLASLTSSEEYQSRFAGMSNEEIVSSIYESLLGRVPDAEGLEYWVDQLESGTLDISTIALNIQDGAQGADQAVVAAKVAAADLFTGQLDTPEEIAAYAGDLAALFGRAFQSSMQSNSGIQPEMRIDVDPTEVPNPQRDLDSIIASLQKSVERLLEGLDAEWDNEPSEIWASYKSKIIDAIKEHYPDIEITGAQTSTVDFLIA